MDIHVCQIQFLRFLALSFSLYPDSPHTLSLSHTHTHTLFVAEPFKNELQTSLAGISYLNTRPLSLPPNLTLKQSHYLIYSPYTYFKCS